MAKTDATDPTLDPGQTPADLAPVDVATPAAPAQVLTMVDGTTRPAPTGAGFIVRNVAASYGHYMDNGVCEEIAPGSFVILDHEPRALSVELHLQKL